MGTACVICVGLLAPALFYDPVAPMKSKRVAGGEPLLQRDPKLMPYDAVRWFAWIGDSYTTCSHSWWNRFGFAVWGKHCAPVPSDGECGGALITPFIIQTACHCLAIWSFEDKFNYIKKKIVWLPATVIHYWEDRKDIYLGYNQVDKFEFYAFSLGFFVHQKCAQTAKNFAGVTTHDFGWIRLDRPVWDTDYNQPGFIIDYPPLYVEYSLIKLTKEALASRAFCLVIGFGTTERNASSSVLKHGWNQLLDYELCYRSILLYADLSERWGADELKAGISWSCARPGLGRFGGRHAQGDSGGPITCNKHYLFLVSFSGYMDPNDEDFPSVADLTYIMAEAALIYAVRENVFEYREAFMKEVWEKDPHNPELRILDHHPTSVTPTSRKTRRPTPRNMSATISPFLSRFGLLLLLFLTSLGVS